MTLIPGMAQMTRMARMTRMKGMTRMGGLTGITRVIMRVTKMTKGNWNE